MAPSVTLKAPESAAGAAGRDDRFSARFAWLLDAFERF